MATVTLPTASGTPRFPLLRTALTLVLLAVLGWSFGVATVWAQKAGDAKGLTKAEVNAILRAGNIPDQPAFESYVTKEILSPFGVSGPPADRLYKLRKDLKIYLSTGRSGQAHDELNRMTLAKMKEIVGGSKYDSAAKVNAMIVIGELNDVDEPKVEELPGGGIRAPGRTPIHEVSEALGHQLPDEEWDSVGGLVFNLLGHVPEAGETVRFQGLEFRTERVDGRRIASVVIRPVDAPDDEKPAPDSAEGAVPAEST